VARAYFIGQCRPRWRRITPPGPIQTPSPRLQRRSYRELANVGIRRAQARAGNAASAPY
jgi:hypothetical protein